jgi:hypothetical protein
MKETIITAVGPDRTLKTGKEIRKGSVVHYKDGWMEVTAKFKNHVNLGHIFYGKTRIKKVPLTEVYEDHEAWYSTWQTSEAYQCM